MSFAVLQWSEDEDAEVYGPFTAQQMLEWQEAGFFKSGVWARQLNKVRFYLNWFTFPPFASFFVFRTRCATEHRQADIHTHTHTHTLSLSLSLSLCRDATPGSTTQAASISTCTPELQ